MMDFITFLALAALILFLGCLMIFMACLTILFVLHVLDRFVDKALPKLAEVYGRWRYPLDFKE